jgi:hypothetical protein
MRDLFARVWRLRRGILAVELSLGLILTSGCGGPANGRLGISGTVILDGKPLDQGVITFASDDPESPSSGAMVLEGEFQIPDGKGLRPGEYKVAIDAADEGGATGTPGADYTMVIPLSKIPPKYNTETTLKAQVISDGDNDFVFDLSTKQ